MILGCHGRDRRQCLDDHPPRQTLSISAQALACPANGCGRTVKESLLQDFNSFDQATGGKCAVPAGAGFVWLVLRHRML